MDKNIHTLMESRSKVIKEHLERADRALREHNLERAGLQYGLALRDLSAQVGTIIITKEFNL